MVIHDFGSSGVVLTCLEFLSLCCSGLVVLTVYRVLSLIVLRNIGGCIQFLTKQNLHIYPLHPKSPIP